MEESRKEDEDRALALAALSLAKAVIDVLERNELLKDGEVRAIFDRALTTLEFRAQDGATGLARRIVEGIAITRTAQGPEKGGASDGSQI